MGVVNFAFRTAQAARKSTAAEVLMICIPAGRVSTAKVDTPVEPARSGQV